MKISYTTEFLKNFKKLSKKNKAFKIKTVEKINLFIANKNHPSLRLHKLKGSLKEAWSISIDRGIRIIFCYTKNVVLFVDIGEHDQVYGN